MAGFLFGVCLSEVWGFTHFGSVYHVRVLSTELMNSTLHKRYKGFTAYNISKFGMTMARSSSAPHLGALWKISIRLVSVDLQFQHAQAGDCIGVRPQHCQASKKVHAITSCEFEYRSVCYQAWRRKDPEPSYVLHRMSAGKGI